MEETGFQLVYALDMNDPDQSCPESLKLSTHRRRRLCGRKTDGSSCDSIVIPTNGQSYNCLLYTSPSPRDATLSRMPSSA